jgi:hypothetical protein
MHTCSINASTNNCESSVFDQATESLRTIEPHNSYQILGNVSEIITPPLQQTNEEWVANELVLGQWDNALAVSTVVISGGSFGYCAARTVSAFKAKNIARGLAWGFFSGLSMAHLWTVSKINENLKNIWSYGERVHAKEEHHNACFYAGMMNTAIFTEGAVEAVTKKQYKAAAMFGVTAVASGVLTYLSGSFPTGDTTE